jgi:hypothetical protein
MIRDLQIPWEKPSLCLLGIGLFFLAGSITANAATVAYTEDNTGYYTTFTSGGNIFDEGARLGMWANSGNKQVVAWRTLKLQETIRAQTASFRLVTFFP